MKKRSKKIKSISITKEVQRQLIEEFGVTGQTVMLALKFHLYSDTAKAIRKRTQELMDEQVKKNQALMAELEDVESSTN